jgi:hypothetical protein
MAANAVGRPCKVIKGETGGTSPDPTINEFPPSPTTPTQEKFKWIKLITK